MTMYEDEAETRRTSVGAKVLIFGFAIFATLGAFWTIVWFIRSYVEQPRVSAPVPMALASRESHPAPPPQPSTPPFASASAAESPPPAAAIKPEALVRTAPPAAAPPSDLPATTAQAAPPPPAAVPAPAGAVADRWFPATQFPANQPQAAPPAAPPPAFSSTNSAAPVSSATPMNGIAPSAAAPAAEPPAAQEGDSPEVAAVMEPAISGRAPLPRRKPPANGTARLREPPLPRPRPDGSAPSSVWTAVPVEDDRFPAATQ